MSEHITSDEIMLLPLSTTREEEKTYDPLLDEEVIVQSKTSKVISTKLSEVKAGLATFMAQVDTLLKDTSDTVGAFNLEEVEISAGITATGSFVLLGIGGEGSVEGGIRFLYKKRGIHSHEQTSS